MITPADFLHDRAFRSLLLHADISKREEQGQLPRAIDPLSSPRLLGRFAEGFSPELVDESEQMSYVYGLMYCFENAVRDLVCQRLEERKGPNWWDDVPERVRKYVDGKRQEAKENKWHDAPVTANIDYTLFGHLASIMMAQWQEFDDLFPTQTWIVQRLQEVEKSRNIVMHGNVLPLSEIERIERYVTDWLSQVP